MHGIKFDTIFTLVLLNALFREKSRKLIGNRIKTLREAAGLTQEELAEKAGILRPNLTRIEVGKYSTGQDILSKIAINRSVKRSKYFSKFFLL